MLHTNARTPERPNARTPERTNARTHVASIPLALIIVFALALSVRAEVIYVKADGSDTANNGESWSTAYATVQKALNASNSTRNQIWVKHGDYYPDTGPDQTDNSPTSTFRLRNNIAMYGGFAGTESDVNQRDLSNAAYETVLSGDLDQDGNYDSGLDAYHVVTCDPESTDDTILDGCTIERGYATGSGADGGGAGFMNINVPTSAAFRHCVFQNNHSVGGAAAAYIHTRQEGDPPASNVTFEDCTFLANSAGAISEQSTWGGAVYCSLKGNTTFDRCTFLGNHADGNGGALACAESTIRLENCLFSGNTSGTSSVARKGGAVYLHASAWTASTDATFVNCVFSKNSATGDGDADGGGAIYCEAEHVNGSEGEGDQFLYLTVENSVVWYSAAGNPPTDYNQIAEDENDGDGNTNEVTITVTYTDIQHGGFGGSSNHNIDADPHFRDLDGPDETAGTVDDDLRLGRYNACINSGDNQAGAGDYDLDGNTRILDTYCDADGEPDSATIDMGAYEYQAFGLIHVDKDATGDNDGSSWTDAYTDLQSALADADSDYEVCEIWAAEGAYKPDDCTACGTGDRASTFTLVDGVGVYGGFVGGANGETERDQRDPASHETILDGEIGLASLTRVYHVVTIPANALSGTILDGFTIKRGKADGTSAANYDRGGGIYLVGGSSVIQNCELSDNDGIHGGALYLGTNAQPTLKQLDFWENTATYGGAMYATQAAPQMSDCVFSGNIADNGSHAGNGGAVYVTSGSAATGGFNVTRCRFSGNESEDNGGAFYITGSSGAEPAFRNCQFSTNKARKNGSNEHLGGAIYTQRAVFLLNSTFARNIATLANGGGALYLAGGNTDIKNCIFWENKADGDRSDEADQIVVYAGSPTARNTCIEDMDLNGVLYHATNTLFDPQFVSSTTDDYELDDANCGTENGCTSKSIDRGEDDYCYDTPCTDGDVELRPRRVNLDNLPDDVDMGSLETQSP